MIEYSITNMGQLFSGIGLMFLFLAVTYGIILFLDSLKPTFENWKKDSLLDTILLEKMALSHGIDLDKELFKRDFMRKKSFRKQKEEEFKEQFFKDKKK